MGCLRNLKPRSHAPLSSLGRTSRRPSASLAHHIIGCAAQSRRVAYISRSITRLQTAEGHKRILNAPLIPGRFDLILLPHNCGGIDLQSGKKETAAPENRRFLLRATGLLWRAATAATTAAAVNEGDRNAVGCRSPFIVDGFRPQHVRAFHDLLGIPRRRPRVAELRSQAVLPVPRESTPDNRD